MADWTRDEVEATVADYLDMLEAELLGRPYSKTEHRNRLARVLRGRSDGAIERKRQNISAVLIELGFLYIDGYKPLRNFQRSLLPGVVEAQLRGRPRLLDLVLSDVETEAARSEPGEILRCLRDPPEPFAAGGGPAAGAVREHPAPASGIDYLAIEARNRSLGEAGEEFVVRYERERLRRARRERLAERVERVSVTRGDGLGFDVLSFEESGAERWIEVKTTAGGAWTRFFVTSREVEVSRAEPDRYHLYRAFRFRSGPLLFTRPGPIDRSFRLVPSQFVARIA